jgi:hypothetical protein
MPASTPRGREDAGVVLSSIWTASRGAQVVHCELVVPAVGRPILRCGYGPHAVIRSQCIPSEDAAAAIAEVWKAALMEHGFRVQSGRPGS